MQGMFFENKITLFAPIHMMMERTTAHFCTLGVFRHCLDDDFIVLTKIEIVLKLVNRLKAKIKYYSVPPAGGWRECPENRKSSCRKLVYFSGMYKMTNFLSNPLKVNFPLSFSYGNPNIPKFSNQLIFSPNVQNLAAEFLNFG